MPPFLYELEVPKPPKTSPFVVPNIVEAACKSQLHSLVIHVQVDRVLLSRRLAILRERAASTGEGGAASTM